MIFCRYELRPPPNDSKWSHWRYKKRHIAKALSATVFGTGGNNTYAHVSLCAIIPLPNLKTSTLTAFQETHSENTPSFNIRSKIAEPVVAAFIAGGVAGAVSRTIVSPLERLKILLQVQSAGREEYRLSIWKALVKMWREEGWKGFMRGNGTNCIRIVPYSAVQFGSYNFYKKVSYKAKAISTRETRIPFDSIHPHPFPEVSLLYIPY